MKGNSGQFKAVDYTDYRGQYFTVLYNTGKKANNGAHIWLAKCDCGKEFEVGTGHIKRRKSCGCQNDRKVQPKDFTGKTEKGFEILEKTDKRINGYAVWKCRCTYCGKENEFPSRYFTQGVCSCECNDWKNEFAQQTGRRVLPNKQSHVNIVYEHYKRGAKDRGYEFNLTKEQARAFFESNCYYCGAEPIARYTAKGCAGEYKWNGIDRVDNSKGYTIDNCVSCCKMCNIAKSTNDIETFKKWAVNLYNHWASKGGDANV